MRQVYNNQRPTCFDIIGSEWQVAQVPRRALLQLVDTVGPVTPTMEQIREVLRELCFPSTKAE